MLESRLPTRPLSVRLIGVGVSNLSVSEQQQRFAFDEPDEQRDDRLDKVTDQIQERFGKHAIGRALGRGQSPSADKHSAADP